MEAEQTIEISQVANVRQQFERRGFAFTEGGKLKEQPRCFGVAKGCTLELVGGEAIEQATIVAVMAPDDEKTSRLNGFRMAALLALLAGERGVKWIGWAMKRAQGVPQSKVTVKDTLGGWQLTMVVNRGKSAVTLKVRASDG